VQGNCSSLVIGQETHAEFGGEASVKELTVKMKKEMGADIIIYLREEGFEGGRLMKIPQDFVQWHY
jgi:hypothetical protein